MSRRRKARLDLSSPALDAIHMDNTIAKNIGETTDPQSAAEPVLPDPPSVEPAPVAHTIRVKDTAVQPKALPKRPAPKPAVPATSGSDLALPAHPLSFRLGLTDQRVLDAAQGLAQAHGADPVLVLKRFQRDGLKELKVRLASGDLTGFSPVTARPRALVVLGSTTRIDRDALDLLKAHMDPLDLFAPSAILGFALDQILSEQQGG